MAKDKQRTSSIEATGIYSTAPKRTSLCKFKSLPITEGIDKRNPRRMNLMTALRVGDSKVWFWTRIRRRPVTTATAPITKSQGGQCYRHAC